MNIKHRYYFYFLQWKRFLSLHPLILAVLTLVLISGCSVFRKASRDTEDQLLIPRTDREFRAVWVATVANIDWPSKPGLSTQQQKAELRAILDRAEFLKMNAVIFQVRPAADALYDSKYEPWSEFLTGKMGKAPDPYYDPLKFAVREAHKRGLELHAWFNPYRAWHPAEDSAIAPSHVSVKHPEFVRQYGDYLWLDPGAKGAQDYTYKVIMDVVKRYDIDGVHFDDYFYPYKAYAKDGNTEFPDSLEWVKAVQNGDSLSRADWRRSNVDSLVHRVYEGVKAEKPWVKFGISPFGIWRPDHPKGVDAFDAYDELYADSRKWLRKGWVDYFTPQLYYHSDNTNYGYPIMLDWWEKQNIKNRHLWPGNFTSRVLTKNRHWKTGEIIKQIHITRDLPEEPGNVHFSMQALMKNPEKLDDQLLTQVYQQPAIVPASPWLGNDSPNKPFLKMQNIAGNAVLTMMPGGGEKVRLWVIKSRFGKHQWQTEIVPGWKQSHVIKRNGSSDQLEWIVVTGVDRLGNEGPEAVLNMKNH